MVIRKTCEDLMGSVHENCSFALTREPTFVNRLTDNKNGRKLGTYCTFVCALRRAKVRGADMGLQAVRRFRCLRGASQ